MKRFSLKEARKWLYGKLLFCFLFFIPWCWCLFERPLRNSAVFCTVNVDTVWRILKPHTRCMYSVHKSKSDVTCNKLSSFLWSNKEIFSVYLGNDAVLFSALLKRHSLKAISDDEERRYQDYFVKQLYDTAYNKGGKFFVTTILKNCSSHKNIDNNTVYL